MLENTYTTDHLIERIAIMRKYYNIRLFSGGEQASLADVVRLEGGSPHTLQVLKVWVEAFAQASISPLVVYEALDAVEEDISGVPSVMLYVPCSLEMIQVERLGTWFRKQVHPNVLLSLRVDAHVIGGCAFVWNDVYYDFSIRYFVRQRQQEVFAMFDRHLHGTE